MSTATPALRMETTAKLAVILAAVLIGTTGTAQALGPASSTPLGVGAVRALLGAVAMWRFVPSRSWGTVRSAPGLVLLGSLGVAVYQPAFFVGVDRLGVALGTILAIGSGPAFAGLIDWGLGRRPTSRWLTGTSLAVIGGSIIVSFSDTGDTTGRFDGWGIAGALGAGLGYAVYASTANLLGRRGADSTEVLAWQFSFGSLALVPLLAVEPMGWLVTPSGALMALHLGIVTIAVAYWLIGFGLARLDTPTVTTLIQAEPVTASLFAVIVLGEVLPLPAWLGALMVVAGLLVAGGAFQRRSTMT